MKRKLIKQGGSGLVAYIPKKWIDEKGLKAGDELSFLEEDEDLILSAKPQQEKKSVELDFRQEDPIFIRIIINDLYRSGVDSMRILYASAKQLEIINETVNNYLLGFEITDKNKQYVCVENITLPEEEKQELLLRRIFFIIEDMFDAIGARLSTKKEINHEIIAEYKRKIGQYDNFSRRNISKKKFYQESSSFYWMLYGQLYLISHSLFHLYEVLRNNPRYSSTKKVAETFSKINVFYQTVTTSFFKKDLNTLKKLNTSMKNFLYDEVYLLIKSSSGVESLATYYLAELSRLLYKMNHPILGILLKDQVVKTKL
jgi:hypothetical protein